MNIEEQKNKVKEAIKKVCEIYDNTSFENLISEDDFVFTDDTSKALSNKSYCFSLDGFAPKTLVEDVLENKVSEKWFQSMLTNGMVGNYNGEIREKCNYDKNFKKNARQNKIENIMYDSLTNFGYGDGIVKEINVNNFQFFVKITPELPMASEIIEYEDTVYFKENKLYITKQHFNNRKDDIVINIYCPCIINKETQFNKFIEEGKV